ncbi:metal-dependent hydrolase [Butyrivibrio sp. FC2001]|uniref:metal-dependent hydrolase n=1 Tax=Butyrivibrio sp. FC2001 TaxID=1280671 RepID=UPI0003FD517C|nr:metal-dependent hydrolase [Butyrivibrio sp. FC2001]
MMGYTHSIIGSTGALAIAMANGASDPKTYVTAVVAGALGGVIIDIDTKDNKTNPKVTDAGRTRLATLGVLLIGLTLDFFYGNGIVYKITEGSSTVIGGIIIFLLILIIGYKSEHRTFTHSLLFIILTGACVINVIPEAGEYYLIGGILHLALDALNYPFNHHGIWLLYPIKKGKGLALGWCKSARKANKALYFMGLIFFLMGSIYYFTCIQDIRSLIVPLLTCIYTVISTQIVRIRSEREQRHIMHMRGEI